MGRELSPQMLAAVQELYAAEQQVLAGAFPASASDLAYGPHERQRLDLYRSDCREPAPVIIWVHGGGFVRGDKGDATRWPNAHFGRVAARAGYVGVVINYRLAPDHGWPAGGEDLLAAIQWCRTRAAEHGGDAQRIILAGTSAGAAHVATALQLGGGLEGVRGAVLLSGLYGVMPYDDPRDIAYYGADASSHAERAPLEALVASAVPLFVACAEFDPPRFQSEWLGLLQQRFARHGVLSRNFFGSGHNHFSLAYHLGSADRRLEDELIEFVQDVTA
ncbi:MAG: alpha/beta hydrolase [Novosphingobium sp.]